MKTTSPPLPEPPVKTSLETLCFMVLNLETFDSFVFHRHYFTAVFKQTRWHPYPCAAELSAARGRAMCNQTDEFFQNSRLRAASLSTRQKASSSQFSGLISLQYIHKKRVLLPLSNSCGFDLKSFLVFTCSVDTLETEAYFCLVEIIWAWEGDSLKLKM